jgi:hypothetical protein
MANEEHLARLKEGMAAWNRWWKEHYPVLRQRGSSALQRAWGAAAPTGRQGLQALKETSQKTFDRLRVTPWQALARRHWKLLLVVGVVIMVGIIWKIPQWQAAGWQDQMEPKDLAKLQNDARTTLVQALGGAALLIGLYFTLRNLQLTQDKQITEHYTRAVEQLGSDKLEVRLGAIYALERIARDSERDHWPIMEILTAYVRENACWEEEQPRSEEESAPSDPHPRPNKQPSPRFPTDIQAILTVLGRRTRTFGKGEEHGLDLSHTNLSRANLWGAQLQRASLWGAQLQRARLGFAQLQGARLGNTHLQGANLTIAQLQGADLGLAQLQGADLRGAQLQRADLGFANLEGAENLTVEQLGTVNTLCGAHLDLPLLERIQQQYPQLLEESSALKMPQQ